MIRAHFLGARVLAFFALLGVFGVANAVDPREARPEELAMLPRWCQSTQGFIQTAESGAEYSRLVQTYGPGWTHMHHYCMALLALARQDRKFPRPTGTALVTDALWNMNYVLERTDRSFAPRAEVLAKKARTQAQYVSRSAAASTSQLLIREFPTYVDGYIILAEMLLKDNQRDAAMKILNEGAEAVSDKERFEKMKTLLPLK